MYKINCDICDREFESLGLEICDSCYNNAITDFRLAVFGESEEPAVRKCKETEID